MKLIDNQRAAPPVLLRLLETRTATIDDNLSVIDRKETRYFKTESTKCITNHCMVVLDLPSTVATKDAVFIQIQVI